MIPEARNFGSLSADGGCRVCRLGMRWLRHGCFLISDRALALCGIAADQVHCHVAAQRARQRPIPSQGKTRIIRGLYFGRSVSIDAMSQISARTSDRGCFGMEVTTRLAVQPGARSRVRFGRGVQINARRTWRIMIRLTRAEHARGYGKTSRSTGGVSARFEALKSSQQFHC